MAAVYVSSPESSPIRFAGPHFHTHTLQKRESAAPLGTKCAAASSSAIMAAVHDNDGDDSDGETSSSEVEEVQGSQFRCVPAAKRKRQRTSAWITRGPQHGVSSAVTVSEVLQKLDVVEVQTSGYQNNCLWYSTQLAMGALESSTEQYTAAAKRDSSLGRDAIHNELLCALPNCEWNDVGPFYTWWAGQSRSTIQDIYTTDAMMTEVHICARAHLLQRPIVVVDSRKRPLISLMLYRPEYVLPCALALGEACKMRTSNPACLWVRLHGEHFRALLPRVIDIC